jgi:hypothetical protein
VRNGPGALVIHGSIGSCRFKGSAQWQIAGVVAAGIVAAGVVTTGVVIVGAVGAGTDWPRDTPKNLRQAPQPPHTNHKTLCHKTRETTQIPVPGPLTGPLNRLQPAYPHGMPCQGKSYVNVKATCLVAMSLSLLRPTMIVACQNGWSSSNHLS